MRLSTSLPALHLPLTDPDTAQVSLGVFLRFVASLYDPAQP